jgi:hypothetical protein
MLYFPSSWRSFPHFGSLAEGRYSSTSNAHRSAFGMPTFSNATASSSIVAVSALTLPELGFGLGAVVVVVRGGAVVVDVETVVVEVVVFGSSAAVDPPPPPQGRG